MVILDNGHGNNTPGKRSPKWKDGTQLFEWEFNRRIVSRIGTMCLRNLIPYHILVPEDYDVSLPVRAKRANEAYKKNKKAFLISIHANAGGGTGWEAWTSVGKTKSDDYATVLYEEATKEFAPEWKIRTDYHSDGDADKESQLTILTKTACPAILSENFFMDTEKDCKFIMSEEGMDRIARFHFEAIKRIINL